MPWSNTVWGWGAACSLGAGVVRGGEPGLGHHICGQTRAVETDLGAAGVVLAAAAGAAVGGAGGTRAAPGGATDAAQTVNDGNASRGDPPAAEPGPQRRAAHNPDAKPGEEHPGEATFKLTVNVPVSLHQRAAGVVRYAEMTGEPEEILSLTDLVRNALAELVTHYEKKYNEGAPFPTPKRLRRGRR